MSWITADPTAPCRDYLRWGQPQSPVTLTMEMIWLACHPAPTAAQRNAAWDAAQQQV